MKKKIIAVFIVTLVVFMISGCSANIEKNDNSEIGIVNELYKLHNTYIGDASGVRAIIDLANNTEYKVENIELKTDNEPFRLTINFAVDNRSKYRYIDDDRLNKMSGLIFALVPNTDEISYLFYDDYAEKNNPDDAFSSAYYTKENLCERMSAENITPDYIIKSTDTIKSFEEYYKTIISLETTPSNREFLDEVYEFIGDDCEIVANSGIGTELILDNYSEKEIAVISKNLSRILGKYQAAEVKAQLVTYDIRNFKTNEYKKCVFMYYTHPDEGLIMILSEFIDDERFENIKKFIANQN